MDCRQFRKKHAYFIDDMLSGVDTWAMRDHVAGCLPCSRLDAQLRRSLLLARQAVTIEPSRNFQRRLSARLAAERLARPFDVQPVSQGMRFRIPFIAAAAAVSIGVAGLGVLGVSLYHDPAPPPVAVAAPAPESSTLHEAKPVRRRGPVHPAVLMAERAAVELAESQARTQGPSVTH